MDVAPLISSERDHRQELIDRITGSAFGQCVRSPRDHRRRKTRETVALPPCPPGRLDVSSRDNERQKVA